MSPGFVDQMVDTLNVGVMAHVRTVARRLCKVTQENGRRLS